MSWSKTSFCWSPANPVYSTWGALRSVQSIITYDYFPNGVPLLRSAYESANVLSRSSRPNMEHPHAVRFEKQVGLSG